MTRVVTPSAYGGPEVLQLTEIQTPEPGPDEVRVAVRAVGVNPIDWKGYSGMMGTDGPLGTIGVEAAGVVDALGEGVEGWSVGDEVVAYGFAGEGYADHLLAGADRKESGLSFEQAASLPVVAGTAVHALETVGVADGETVLIHGAAGGVGTMAVQLARRLGARVIGTAGPANHDFLRSLGAEPVTYGDGLADRVRELAPDGIDAALDLVGSDEALETSIDLTGGTERVVTIANFARGPELGVHLIGGGPGADPGTETRVRARREVARLVADGTVSLEIADTYPLTEVAAAHTRSREGHTRGKLVVVP
jgi:NADPH:quinone reductase-like Zn-dependent oxidoreductase